MNEKYLYVLDFGNCSLNCIHLEEGNYVPDEFPIDEDILRYWGFNPNNCQWMFSSDELEINNIVVPLKD